MADLISIKKRDGSGRNLRVIDWITSSSTAQCDDFAHMLLRDSVVVQQHQKETRSNDMFVRAVLSDWLSRADGDPDDEAVPRTWGALAECVEDAGLEGALARAIRDECLQGVLNNCVTTRTCIRDSVPHTGFTQK